MTSAAFAQPAPGDSASTAAVPQRDIMDVLGRLIGREVQSQAEIHPTQGLSVTFLPSIGYNPAYGAFVGVSAVLGGWLGDPATTTTSYASAGASYSTTKQISLQLKSDIFTAGNGLDLKGDWRYLDTSQPTYGLGPVTSDQQKYPMNFVLIRIYETVYKGIPGSPLFFGLGYHLDQHRSIDDLRASAGEITPFVTYSRGYPRTTTASGVSANVLYESRDNTINPTRGVFWNASLRSFNRGLGSDESWQGLISDVRLYSKFPRGGRNTFAIWNYEWLTFGGAPYLCLPAVGWDTYGRGGRGYIQGRIRGQSQIYTEGEYRVSLTPDGLWGAVGFLNLMATTPTGGGAFGNLDPGGGVGLRLKFNKRTSTNATMDFAWGETVPMHIFFGLAEVF